MRRKVTKAAALLSAVLMASSSVPYGVLIPYNVLAEIGRASCRERV